MFSQMESLSDYIFILFYESFRDFSFGAVLARLHDGASAVLNDVAKVEYLSTSIRSLHDVVMCDL